MLLTYFVIVMVALIFLNYYPLIVARDFIVSAKSDEMKGMAGAVAVILSGQFEQDYAAIERRLVRPGNYDRMLITDNNATVLYDSALQNNTEGKKAVLGEIYSAVNGKDVFVSRLEKEQFSFSAAAPVESADGILGSVYLYKVSKEEALLLRRTQSQILFFSLALALMVLGLSSFFSFLMTRQIKSLSGGVAAMKEGVYGAKVDVSADDELGRLASAFNELNSKMLVTEQKRREFVSNASHELKTPLASIKLLVDSIISAPDMDKELMESFLFDINNEIERLVRITERLFTLTRVDSGIVAEKTLTDASDEVKNAARLLYPVAKERGITLSCYAQSGLFLFGPADAFSQIVYNLIDNAIKYNKDGGSVEVRLIETGDSLVLRVRDTGVGIPEEERERIFGRFYRVDKARSRETGGTGLGLAIVKDNVELLHGQIRVTSQPGEGSAFTVILPKNEGGGENGKA